MPQKAQQAVFTAPPRPLAEPRPRLEAKRVRIIDAAMRYFAEQGYHATRIEDLAAELNVAKGSIFQYFGSKAGLFLETYRKAARSFPKYLDCAASVREKGFFEVLRYWLTRTEHMLHEDWIPYRVVLLGNYGVDLSLKREINRFLISEDPYGSAAVVRFAIGRGEVRSDVDPAMIASILEWTMERFQDALLTEELDPGLFPHPSDPEKNKIRIHQFLAVLRGAIGARQPRERDDA
ncbi:MAG: helix-turn-helix domain-containing protein [Candidatus Acidiferrales bacterium]